MGNGAKVYYLPTLILHDDTIAPQLSGFLPGIREILIKEDVDILHFHQVSDLIKISQPQCSGCNVLSMEGQWGSI
jgi:phosphatidylinositol glycan class A protein